MDKENIFFDAKWLASENNFGYGQLPLNIERDKEISLLIKKWTELDQIKRQDAASKITEEQQPTLLAYSERMASKAVREKSLDDIFSGLIALGLDGWRFDWRENTILLSLHYHSTLLIGEEPFDIFNKAAALLSAKVKLALQSFLKRSPEDKSIEAMGYIESHDESGFRYKRNW